MIRARSHMNVLLKLTLASACAAMVVLWPTWRVALQTFGSYQEGRMTGGGNCTVTGVKVTHGFALHCDRRDEPNNLEVNWQDETGSHQFHLEDLQFADCSGDSRGEHPVAGFDTYFGYGLGRLDGDSGAFATWTFTDEGESGRNDLFEIVIIPQEGGEPVLSISCTLEGGNHQAHPK